MGVLPWLLDGEFLDDPGGSLAEWHRTFSIRFVAYGDDGSQVVVLGVVGYWPQPGTWRKRTSIITICLA